MSRKMAKRISPTKEEVDRVCQELEMSTIPPTDWNQRCLTNGMPVTPDHKEIQADGQQKAYVVLTADERAKGFIRPVRQTYTHITCGTHTTMGMAIAETYAREPKFYCGSYCSYCQKHFPLDEFVWKGSKEKVGS